MVNQKRVERKLPLLITEGPWWTFETDRNEYRVQQFKKREPARFRQHRDQLIADLEKFKRDVNALFNNGK